MAAPWNRGVQVRVIGELHGSETNNVMNFATNTVFTDNAGGELRDALLALGNAVLVCIRETLLPGVTSDWKVSRVEIRPIFPAAGDPVEVPALATDVGEGPPTNVSFAASLVRVRTGIGGRRGRGRWFLPPPGDANITASDIDPATLVILAQFLACLAQKFIGATATTPWRVGVLSRTDAGPTLANFDAGFREATTLLTVATCAKIGSRKKGIGS